MSHEINYNDIGENEKRTNVLYRKGGKIKVDQL